MIYNVSRRFIFKDGTHGASDKMTVEYPNGIESLLQGVALTLKNNEARYVIEPSDEYMAFVTVYAWDNSGWWEYYIHKETSTSYSEFLSNLAE